MEAAELIFRLSQDDQARYTQMCVHVYVTLKTSYCFLLFSVCVWGGGEVEDVLESVLQYMYIYIYIYTF